MGKNSRCELAVWLKICWVLHKKKRAKHVSNVKMWKKGHLQINAEWSGCVERVLSSQPHEWIMLSITWHWAQSAKDYLIYASRFMPWYVFPALLSRVCYVLELALVLFACANKVSITLYRNTKTKQKHTQKKEEKNYAVATKITRDTEKTHAVHINNTRIMCSPIVFFAFNSRFFFHSTNVDWKVFSVAQWVVIICEAHHHPPHTHTHTHGIDCGKTLFPFALKLVRREASVVFVIFTFQ